MPYHLPGSIQWMCGLNKKDEDGKEDDSDLKLPIFRV